MARQQQRKMDGMVRTAIPRAKPVGGSRGPMPGGPRNGATKIAPADGGNGEWSGSADASAGGIKPTRQPRSDGAQFLGRIPESSASRPSRIPNMGFEAAANDIAGDMMGGQRQSTQTSGGQSNIEGLLAEIARMTNQRPSRGQDMGNAFGDFFASGRQIAPAPRPVVSAPVPEARQMGASIAELLRGR